MRTAVMLLLLKVNPKFSFQSEYFGECFFYSCATVEEWGFLGKRQVPVGMNFCITMEKPPLQVSLL